MFTDYNVGPTGKFCDVQPVADAQVIKCFSQSDFRFGGFTTNFRHLLTALCSGVETIGFFKPRYADFNLVIGHLTLTLLAADVYQSKKGSICFLTQSD